MTIKVLSGLRPNNPLAVMAAYGALRLLPGTRLRWKGPNPEFESDQDPIEALASLLPERLDALEVVAFDDPRRVDDFSALVTSLPPDWQLVTIVEGSEKHLTTDLILLSGKHQFVANARSIMSRLAGQNVPEKLREALFGPWQYDDKGLQAWGWDAGASIDTTASSAEGSKTPKYGVSGASWLAWESLPLWPIINGHTVGWRRGLHYPTCGEWLDWHDLRAIVLGLDSMTVRERDAMSIQTWHAPRIATSQYGGFLGWGRPVARTQSEAHFRGGSRRR